jgi:hypothetical protein
LVGDLYVGGTKIASDKRLKTNIKNKPFSLNEISNLQAVSFNYLKKDDSNKLDNNDTSKVKQFNSIDTAFYNKVRIGFIAQDVQKYIPELVTEDEDGTLYVDYIEMIPLIVECLKELNTKTSKIEELQNEIDELKKLLKNENKDLSISLGNDTNNISKEK